MSRQTRHPLLLRTKNMATAYQNLSEYDFNSVPDGSESDCRNRRSGMEQAHHRKAIGRRLQHIGKTWRQSRRTYL